MQLIGEGSDQQIATEPQRRSGAIQLPPGKPQFVRRPIHQFGDLAVHRGDVCIARSRPFAEVEQGASLLDVGGLRVQVLDLEALARAKRAAGRAKDLLDLAEIAEIVKRMR